MSQTDPRRGAVMSDLPRHPIGIDALDYYMWGGLPAGNVALVVGGQYIGKETLAHRFLAQGMRMKEPSMGILTDSGVDEWKDAIRNHYPSADVDNPEALAFIDMFPVGESDREGRPNVIEVQRPLTAEKAAGACMKAVEMAQQRGHPGRFVFDSLSTLIHERGVESLYGVLPPLMARVRRAGTTGLVLIEDGVLDPAAFRTIQRWFNGVIEMRRHEDKHIIKMEGLGLTRPSPWIQYEHRAYAINITHSWSGGRIH